MPIEFTADQVDQLTASVLPFYVKDKMYAQADQSTPALNRFRDARKTYPGGTEIIINARFGVSNQWELVTDPDQELAFENPSPLRQARYTWEMNHLGLTFSWAEALTAGFSLKQGDSGEFPAVSKQDEIRIMNFIESKFEQVDFDSRQGFSKDRIWSDGTNGFAGIPALITTSPSTGTTGGLSRVTNTLWRNRAATALSWSVANQTLTQRLRSEMVQLRKYGNTKHSAYCGSLFMEALRMEVGEKGYYTQTGFKETDISIPGVVLDGMKFEYEPALDDNSQNDRCYIVDHNNIHLYMHAGNDMTMHEPKRPHNILAYYKSLLWSGAMVATRLNSSAVYEITTTNLPSA